MRKKPKLPNTRLINYMFACSCRHPFHCFFESIKRASGFFSLWFYILTWDFVIVFIDSLELSLLSLYL